MGLHYKSALSPPAGIDTGLVPGTRFPPYPVTRLADWNAGNLQDLAPSDGRWKLIAFVEPKFDLNPLANSLSSDAWKNQLKKSSVNVVIDARAEDVHWRDIPDALLDWQR